MTLDVFDDTFASFQYKSSRRGRRKAQRGGGEQRAGLSTLDANTAHTDRQRSNSSPKKAPKGSTLLTPSVANTAARTTTRTHRLTAPPESENNLEGRGTDKASAREKRKSGGEKEDRGSRAKRARYSESDLDTNTQLVKENARLTLAIKTLTKEAKTLRHRLKVTVNTAESAVDARLRAHTEKADETEVRLKLRIASLQDEKVQVQDKVSAAEQTITDLRHRVTVLEAEMTVLEDEKEVLHETASNLLFTCESVLKEHRVQAARASHKDTV